MQRPRARQKEHNSIIIMQQFIILECEGKIDFMLRHDYTCEDSGLRVVYRNISIVLGFGRGHLSNSGCYLFTCNRIILFPSAVLSCFAI